MTLLEPSLMARLENLQLQSRHRLLGRFGGEHRSKRHGSTVDFADFRQYHPGDDYRRIDYHVLARLDQVLIKLFEADDEVTVRLLMDVSASMAVGGKAEQAKRLAAALGFVALTAHDAVSVHAFPSEAPAPRFAGRVAVPSFFAHLEGLEPGGPTPLSEATGRVLSRPGPPGMSIVLSDLYTPEWPSLVRLRAAGSELVVLHLLAPEDVDPEVSGDLELLDREDGGRLAVSVTEDVAAAYRSNVIAWREKVRATVVGAGGIYLAVDSTADVEELLLSSWRRAGVLR